MAVLLGLMSAVLYGAADFSGGLAARRTPALAVVVWSQVIGLGLLLVSLAFVADGPPEMSDLARGALGGVGGGTGVTLLYRGLAIGRMSVVAPITAVGAAIVPVLFGLATGDRPGAAALLGVAVALAAIMLVSLAPAPAGQPAPAVGWLGLAPGVVEAVLAGIGFGAFFVLLDGTTEQAGLWPLLGARSSIVVAAVGALATRTPLGLHLGWRSQLPQIAVAGVLDMASNILYLLAVRRGLLSIIAVLVSLYPASTVLLARVVLRERLVRPQIIGLAAAAVGVGLIAA